MHNWNSREIEQVLQGGKKNYYQMHKVERSLSDDVEKYLQAGGEITICEPEKRKSEKHQLPDDVYTRFC